MSRNFDLLQKAEEEHKRETESKIYVSSHATVVGSGAAPEEAVVSGEELDDFSREQIARLVHLLMVEQRKAAVFAGLERGAGCTWVTAHAARLLAAEGRGSVCLVDGNLRFPRLHHFFGVSNHHGLSDAVVASGPFDEFVRQLAGSKLWLLSCGSSENSTQALASTESLRNRIKQARVQFDFVLVDSPPLSTYRDALTIGSACDGLVLVLRANVSRRETAQRVLNDAKTASVNVLGAILNQRTFPVPKLIYDLF